MYEFEIPKELVVGEKYTGKQLRYFLSDGIGRDSIVLSDSPLHDDKTYTVKNTEVQFMNRSERMTFVRPHFTNAFFKVDEC